MQQPEPSAGVTYLDSPTTPAGPWAQLGAFIGILATLVAIGATLAAAVATTAIAGTILMSLIP